MNTEMIFGLSIIGIFLVWMYNSLIGKRNHVENTFATIDVMLKKRYDLLPNLVSALKQYMKHENETLTSITELRARALKNDISSDEKVEIDNEINKKMQGIMVSVENYPDLKASEQFVNFQKSMNEIEEQISAARRTFNMGVMEYNNAVEMLPTSLMASIMKLRRKQVLEIPEKERQNVDVGKLFTM